MQANTKTVHLTPKETSARLRVSESTLAKWRMSAAHSLSYVKVGSKVAYDEAVVERWLAGQARKSTSDVARKTAAKIGGAR